MFDKCVIDLDDDISYNYNSGHFTLNPNAVYSIRWWVCGFTGSYDESLSLKISTSRGEHIESSIIDNYGQIYGEAIIKVDNSSLQFALVNNCDTPITLYPHINVKANISINRVVYFESYNKVNAPYSKTVYLNR